MTKTLPRARLAAIAALSLLTACNTVGDGTYLPASIEELIPPGITAEQVYSRPSTPDGVRCYMYQETGIEVLLGCVDIGIMGAFT